MRPSLTAVAALVLVATAGCSGGASPADPEATGDSSGKPSLTDLKATTTCPVQLGESAPSSSSMKHTPYDVSQIPASTDPFVQVVCRFAAQPDDVEVQVFAATKKSRSLFSTDGFGNWAYNETGVDREELERKTEQLSPGEVVVLEGNGQSLAVRGAEVEGSSHALILVAGGNGSPEQLEDVADALQFG